MTNELYEYIVSVEGSYLHMNSTESDITSPGGIYRAEHPDATIWSYIDGVGASLGMNPKSNLWTKQDIKDVDDNLDAVQIALLVKEFYDNYLYGAHLQYFDPLLQIAMFNLYTNSQSGAWKAVQQTVIDMNKIGFLDIPADDLSVVDGGFGGMTKRALIKVDALPDSYVMVYKIMMISNMKTYYAKLVAGNPDKFLPYLSGWMNRMDNLEIA